MKELLVCLLLLPSLSIAGEVNPVKNRISKALQFELYKIYRKRISKTVNHYNTNRTDFKKHVAFLKQHQIGVKNDANFKTLPKAFVENEVLKIAGTNFKYSFKNYLEGALTFGRTTIKMNCQIKAECLTNIYEALTPKKKTSWIKNLMIEEAHADKAYEELVQDQYNIFVAILAMDESFKDVGGFGSILTSDTEINLERLTNLENLQPKITELNGVCHE